MDNGSIYLNDSVAPPARVIWIMSLLDSSNLKSMKKFIKVLLLVRNRPTMSVEIDTTDGLHELEIYTILEQMFPAYIFINFKADETVYQEGYNVEFKNELYAVAIYHFK